MKKITLLILFGFFLSWANFAQVPIGTQDGDTSNVPINSCYNFSYSQQIVYQEEINAVPGDISSISFYYDNSTSGTNNSTDWTIYMGHTDKDRFATNGAWIPLAELSEVFSGTVTYPAQGNFMTITFSNPFPYNNVDNLVIAVDENSPGSNCTIYFGKTAALGAPRSIYYRSNDINPDPASPPVAFGRATYINNMILGGIQESCPAPSNLTVAAVSDTTADVSWTENGSATEWEVLYGPAGFNPAIEGTVLVDDDGTPGTTITGLTENTNYEFYITSVCGAGDNSARVGPKAFRTTCGVASLPYVMDFQDAVIPNLPTCTTRENAGNGNNWETATYTSGGFNGKVLKYGYNSSNAGNAWFYTQGIALEAGEYYQISYKYGNNSTSFTEKMKVAFGTVPLATGMTNPLANHPNIQHAAEVETVTFTVPADGVYYFGFNAYSASNQLNLYLDDINVFVAPTCIAPSDLTVDAVDAYTADLSWTESATATEWEVLYGVSGFNPETQGTVQVVTGAPDVTLTGLDSSTAYDFYVTAICTDDDHSFRIGPESFRTSCVAATVPFVEGFESGYSHDQDLGGCWSQASINGTQNWVVNSTFTTYNRTPRSGNFNVTLRYGNEDWMFYPIELDGGSPYELKFYARQDGATPANASVQAAFGTVNTPAGMTNPVVELSPLSNGDYQEFSGFFTPATSGTYYVGIKGTINSSPWHISLDDISVEAADGCLRPGVLEVANITETTADVSWIESGTATQWNVIYGLAGFDPATAGTTVVANDDPETTLTGLVTDTGYEFYVRAVCGADDESSLSSVKYFFTGYCEFNSPSTSYFISDFSTQNGILNITNLNSGQSPNGYGNFTSQVVMTYPLGDFDFVAEFNGTSTHGFNMYIDFNKNMEFEESEKVYASGGYVTNASGTINIPAGIPNGDYRIRIIADWLGTNPMPCGTINNGEAEDYTLRIGDPPTCMPVTALTVDALYENSADVSWTSQNTTSETKWNVVYGLRNFNPETDGTTIVVEDTPNATITGLESNTVYDFYVRAICSDDDESALAGPQQFRTTCGIASIPYLMNFEDAIIPALPPCTTRENAGSGNNWETATQNGNGFNSKVLKYGWNGSNPGNAWFYTQGVAMEAGEFYQISYLYGSGSTTWSEKMKVAFGTSPQASAMTTQLADHPFIQHNALEEVVTFTVPADGVYYFGFNAYSDANQLNLYLDDINIFVAPTCIAPSDLTVGLVDEDSAQVSWTEAANATTWEVTYGPAGFNPLTAGTTIEVNDTPQTTLTGLTSDTAYEFYVRAICTDDDESFLIGPKYFFTGYCAFSSTSTTYFISDFYTDEGILNISNLNSGQSPNGYGNFTHMEVVTYPTSSFTFDAQFNGNSTYGFNIWIDFNGNMEFEDSEKVYASGSYVSSASGTIQIPVTIPNGNYRMRIVANFLSTNPSPCGVNTNSEAEDYTVTILNAPTCLPPADLTLVGAGVDTATLSWTSQDRETVWNVFYGETGFDPETGGTTIIVEDTPEVTLTDLDSNTRYDVYVQAVCEADDLSYITGPVSFWTNCVATTVPYLMDFETAIVPDLPNCTAGENLGNGNMWTTVDYNSNGFIGNVLRYAYSPSPANAWFYTQGVEMAGGVEYKISYRYGNVSTTWTEKMKVAYGTGTGVGSMTTELANYQAINQGAPIDDTVTFTVPADGVYYFGFNVYSAGNQFNLYLDDIHIEFAADCDAVTDVQVTDVTRNSVTVAWTGNTTATSGYVVDVFLEGADPTTDTPEASAIVPAGINTATVVGLTAETVYDVYVTSDCGNGNVTMSQGVSFDTIDLGVNSNNYTQINYFPNPVKDQLTITAANSIENVTVYNLLGQTIMEVKPNGLEVVLDMAGLPTGTYVLRANVANGVSTFKVIKE